MNLPRHLIDIEDLDAEQIKSILVRSEQWYDYRQEPTQQSNPLAGLTVVNAFFENSTRTRLSFEMAGKQLGAHVINFEVGASSISKGETFEDTIRTLNEMMPHVLVLRHTAEDAAKQAADIMRASTVINAGTGTTSHPTQALLDAYTIKNYIGEFEGLKVTICGDLHHSRVARSSATCLTKLGAMVTVTGPSEFLWKTAPEGITQVESFDDAIVDADVVMMLRYQNERLNRSEYNLVGPKYLAPFKLTPARLERAKAGAMIMHPGPVNRNMEISEELIYGPQSLILQQVQAGTAVRMACLDLLTEELRDSY